jgi:hypothetical protein
MKFQYVVEVEVERIEGKFAPKDEIANEIEDWLVGANQDSIDGIGADGTSEYEITDWSVMAQDA